jgi:hypothetical protein
VHDYPVMTYNDIHDAGCITTVNKRLYLQPSLLISLPTHQPHFPKMQATNSWAVCDMCVVWRCRRVH